MPRVLISLATVFVLACTGEPTPTREWTPADHGQPESAPPERQPAQAEATSDPAQLQRRAAQALWNVSCASCHGRGGRGDGNAPPPGAQMPDFTAAAWQGERRDEELAQTIRDGRGLMPAFAKEINPQGIEALVQHIRELVPTPQEQPAPPTPPDQEAKAEPQQASPPEPSAR